jgi:hypothetical protein
MIKPSSGRYFFFFFLLLYFFIFHLSLGGLFNIEVRAIRLPLFQINIWYSIFSGLLTLGFWGNRYLKSLVLIFLIVSSLIRVIDWNIFYFYGKHIDNIFWSHALYADSTGMINNSVTLITAFLSVAFIILFLVFYRVKNVGLSRLHRLKIMALSITYTLVSSVIIDRFLDKKYIETDLKRLVYKSVPEVEFYRSIKSYFFGQTVLLSKLPATTAFKLEKFAGVKINNSLNNFPFYKKSIYLNSDKKKKKLDIIQGLDTSKTNVIFILLEGFSSHFLKKDLVSNGSLIPNISDAIKNSYSFNNIYNSNTPTFQGQIAVLASMLNFNETTIAKKRDAKKGLERSVLTRFPFFSTVTKNKNYKNINIQSLGAFADSEQTFLNNNYDEYFSIENDEYKKFVGSEIGQWGAVDKKQFEFLIQILERHDDEKPLFVSFKTTDLHHPYDCKYKAKGVNNGLLNCLYSTDVGFGVFWNYFKSSKYVDNTILVITADHSLFPTAEHMQIRKEFRGGYYDLVPLFFISKNTLGNPNISNVRGGSIDIVPTIMDILGWDSPNSFMGLSLISERAQFPLVLAKEILPSVNTLKGQETWSEQDQINLKKYILFHTQANQLTP